MPMIVLEQKVATTGAVPMPSTATGFRRTAKNNSGAVRVGSSASSGSIRTRRSGSTGRPTQSTISVESTLDPKVIEKAIAVLWRIHEQSKDLGIHTPVPQLIIDHECMIFSWQVDGRHLEMEFGPDYAFYSRMEVRHGAFIEEDGSIEDSLKVDSQLGWISGKP